MITIDQALKDTWNFFRGHISWICWILLPVVVPVRIFEIITSWYFDDENTFTATDWVPMLAELLVYPVYQGALVFFLLSTVRSERWSLQAYYTMALRYWPQLLLLYILVGIASVLGILLFIIPGVIVACRVAFAEFFCLFEGCSAQVSFSKSWESTKPVFWLLLQGLLVIYLPAWVLFFSIEYVIGFLDLWNPVLSVVLSCFYTVVLSLMTIFAFRVFTADEERMEKLKSQTGPL